MRKKILILGHNYATQFVDIYNQYSRVFPTEKFCVTVAFLTGAVNSEISQRTIAEHIHFFDFQKRDLRYLKIKAALTLKKFCQQNAFDLIICHRYKATYIMLWLAKFLPASAYIFVMHELHTVRSLRRRLAIWLLARRNMLFAGVSQAVAADIRKTIWGIPAERVITLYNMIDTELTKPQLLTRADARAALQLPEDSFVFGNLARLAPNKDQHSLIKAFALVQQQFPQSKLLILGEGQLESALKALVAELNLQQCVIFTGFVAQGYQYMRAFDCFVLSSTQEAFGRVLLEAMLACVPIIATSVNGIPEVVGDAGMLVPAKNIAALEKAMLAMLQASTTIREQWGADGYQRVLQKFSIPEFSRQFWSLPLLESIKEF